MKRLLIILLLLFSIANLYTLNITLKNGSQLNGELLLFKKSCYYILVDQTLVMIDRNIVESIDIKNNQEARMFSKPSRQKINLLQFPKVMKYDINAMNGRILTINEKRQFHRPNLKLLPLSFGFGFLCYEYFDDYNELSKYIEELKNDNIIVPKYLKNEKDKKLLFGWTFLGVSILNTFIALEKVEIYSDIDYIGVSYKF